MHIATKFNRLLYSCHSLLGSCKIVALCQNVDMYFFKYLQTRDNNSDQSVIISTDTFHTLEQLITKFSIKNRAGPCQYRSTDIGTIGTTTS